MIVGSRFDGDRYEELQLQQHDAYGQALQVMLAEARSRLWRAEALLGASSLGDEVRKENLDHRSIQMIHDLLAAIWRAENSHLQPVLPLPGHHVEKFATQWLVWLGDEMKRWDEVWIRALLKAAYGAPDREREDEALLLEELHARLGRRVREMHADPA